MLSIPAFTQFLNKSGFDYLVLLPKNFDVFKKTFGLPFSDAEELVGFGYRPLEGSDKMVLTVPKGSV